MTVHELSLETLTDLDGARIVEAVNQAITRAVAHCTDLPGETAARKVNLQMEFSPILDTDGGCYEINFAFQIKDALPTRKSKIYTGQVRKSNKTPGRLGIVFNDLSDDDPNQRTLDEHTPFSE